MAVNDRLGIAVIGCGLIGRRRARTAAENARTVLRVVADTDRACAESLGAELGAAVATAWQDVVARDDVHAVAVCTPNAWLAPIACAALERGLHVLIEKPMGRNCTEAESLAAAAHASGRVLKIGFNHRYHRAIARAHDLFSHGVIGRLLHMRARYGHGSRPACEQEWRADRALAGGGELLDQGVHIIDLFHWFAGPPIHVQAQLQTAVWQRDGLEDNAFALLRFAENVVAQCHVSMTQWKNLFSFEIHGDAGALIVEGLGGSYGPERLVHVERNLSGGPPITHAEAFAGEDPSWGAEWDDFVAALDGAPLSHGSSADGVAVMRTIEALYASAQASRPGSNDAAADQREAATVLVP